MPFACSLSALNAQVTVVDRPMTQQGLGGMKTAAKGQTSVPSLIDYFLSHLIAL